MAEYKLNYTGAQINAALGKVLDGVPYNILDNSNFINPVNQRGQSSYSGGVYGIDRWRAWAANATTTISASGIKCGGLDQAIYQYIDPARITVGNTYTVAAGYSDGTVVCGTGVLTATDGLGRWDAEQQVWFFCSEGQPMITLAHATKTFAWAALYEGSYTADTLPAYVPKGYAAELAECQRYYREVYRIFGEPIGNVAREFIVINPNMRIAPTATVKSLWKGTDDSSVSVNLSYQYGADISYTGYGNVMLALSADL